MNLGDKLKELRKERNLTLKQLEEKTGISLPYLSEIERDVSYPTVKTLRKIAESYNLTLAELVGGFSSEESLRKTLPKGLQELIKDSDFRKYFKGKKGEEWIKTLQRVEYRGERPKTKEEWMQLFLNLKNVFKEK